MLFTGNLTATFQARAVTGQDVYGNDVYGTTSVDVPGCIFAPGISAEIVAGRDTVTTQPSLYTPVGTDVTALDRVIVNGVAYEVDGTPEVYAPPFPTPAFWGPVVKLREVTG